MQTCHYRAYQHCMFQYSLILRYVNFSQLQSRVGIRSGRARFTPLDRVDRLKVGPRIDSDRPDRFRVGKYSKVNRSDRFENEMGPTRVPGPGMKREVNFLPSYNIDSHFNCSY